MMDPAAVPSGEAQWIIPTYLRPEVVFERGEGAYLFDSEGKRYLDFASGIAVTALGHSDPAWAAAVAEQARTLTHVSNLFHTRPHVELAQRLISRSFADRVFFCNSGAEANEAALKFARRYARAHHGEGRTGFLAFKGGFHGRTIGALSLTARAKYQAPFEPLMPGVRFAPFNDLDAARDRIDETVCAVFVEPVQGEGGVVPADPAFLDGLRRTCSERDVLLVFDEVQCGLGRTGHLWAHEAYGVEPDILTLAKPLAGGLPIGATLVTEAIAEAVRVGDHGSTFAAGPLVCRAAQVVFDRVSDPELLANVRTQSARLMSGLRSLPTDELLEVRGAGLLIGAEFRQPVKPLIEAAMKQGLIVINAGENVLRMAPPLTIEEGDVSSALDLLGSSLAAIGWSTP